LRDYSAPETGLGKRFALEPMATIFFKTL